MGISDMVKYYGMKTIRVVAAVICGSAKNMNKIFATARGYGEYKGWWEFPAE